MCFHKGCTDWFITTDWSLRIADYLFTDAVVVFLRKWAQGRWNSVDGNFCQLGSLKLLMVWFFSKVCWQSCGHLQHDLFLNL